MDYYFAFSGKLLILILSRSVDRGFSSHIGVSSGPSRDLPELAVHHSDAHAACSPRAEGF
jgi:hypothetical protein